MSVFQKAIDAFDDAIAQSGNAANASSKDGKVNSGDLYIARAIQSLSVGLISLSTGMEQNNALLEKVQRALANMDSRIQSHPY